MFNQDGFNELSFNTSFAVDIFASFSWAGEGDMSIRGVGDYIAKISMVGEGEFNLAAIRDKFAAIKWDGVGEFNVSAIRDKFASIGWDGEGEFTIGASRYRIEEIEITGPFAPGDRIVIDSGKLRVIKNGQNIGYTGDFIFIHPGDNTITYTDTATGRTVQIRITHRDKFLY